MNKSLYTKNPFLIRVRYLEEKLFPNDLDSADATRMKSDKYSWLYRPSHHVSSGLVTIRDIEQLKAGKRMLSIGAHPGFLERTLVELGAPAKNIVLADKDPLIKNCPGAMEKVQFDVLQPWPDIGSFDIIVYPESLCISLSNKIEQVGKKMDPLSPDKSFPNDALEAELLAGVLKQSYEHLRFGGEVRANGPQNHPNVVRKASELLKEQGVSHAIEYDRYLLRFRPAEVTSLSF